MALRLTISTVVIGSVLYLTRYYIIGRRCFCRRDLKGKLIVITGATSGIGLASAKIIAQKGASIVLACRDREQGEAVKTNLIKSTGNPNIYFEPLDLSSFESISEFSKSILLNSPAIFALIKNAGIYYHTSENTIDNIEITFQTNYLGHFLLTLQLLPGLRRFSGNSRIINLSSEAHLYPYLFPQPEYHRRFDDSIEDYKKSYQYSKFCVVLFALKLSEILEKSNISVHCVDPGKTATNILRHKTHLKSGNTLKYYIQKTIKLFTTRTAYEGSQGVIHAILNRSPPFYIKNLVECNDINCHIYQPIFSNILWLLSRKICHKYLTI